jgi:hypothetical protein
MKQIEKNMGQADGRVAATEDRIARAFSRGLTRRSIFKRTMRGSLIVGGALAAPLSFATRASATSCNGLILPGVCECEPSTPNCGSIGAACTPAGACNPSSGLRVRCDAWGKADEQGQYCWCTDTCNYGGGVVGKKVCCDCWKGGSGGCGGGGGTKCLCVHFHPI